MTMTIETKIDKLIEMVSTGSGTKIGDTERLCVASARVVRALQDGSLTKSQLRRKVGSYVQSAEDLDLVLDALVKFREIAVTVEKHDGAGRPTSIYTNR